jgi:hypothetical protein
MQARAQREQPVGGGEAETVAFLRALGFADQNIRIQRGSATSAFPGRLVTIEGWIPQPQGFYTLSQIRAFCKFADDQRLQECYITYGSPLKPNTLPSIDETTPIPGR